MFIYIPYTILHIINILNTMWYNILYITYHMFIYLYIIYNILHIISIKYHVM